MKLNSLSFITKFYSFPTFGGDNFISLYIINFTIPPFFFKAYVKQEPQSILWNSRYIPSCIHTNVVAFFIYLHELFSFQIWVYRLTFMYFDTLMFLHVSEIMNYLTEIIYERFVLCFLTLSQIKYLDWKYRYVKKRPPKKERHRQEVEIQVIVKYFGWVLRDFKNVCLKDICNNYI